MILEYAVDPVIHRRHGAIVIALLHRLGIGVVIRRLTVNLHCFADRADGDRNFFLTVLNQQRLLRLCACLIRDKGRVLGIAARPLERE